MKNILCITLLSFFGLTTLTAAPKPGVKLKSEADSLAYYAGSNLGQYVRSIDSTMNLSLLMGGLKDALANNEAANAEASYAFLSEYMTVRRPAHKLAESEAFLARIEQQPGVQKTKSGLLYRIDRQGDMSIAVTNDHDQVRVTYQGMLPDGTVFDSWERHGGDTLQFALNNVILGWTEGMKLIGKGGKITLWIHPDLAYGMQGSSGGAIGPNQAIVFEVELLDVTPYEPSSEEPQYDQSETEYDEEEIQVEELEQYVRENEEAYMEGYREGYGDGYTDGAAGTNRAQ